LEGSNTLTRWEEKNSPSNNLSIERIRCTTLSTITLSLCITKESRRLTKQEFVDRANKVHNFKYDYSKLVYKNSTTKVVIICPIHGQFLQVPPSHLKGSGCPDCGRLSSDTARKLTKQEFVDRANKVHDFKYDYSEFVYKDLKTKGTIICPIHGPFLQTPHNHLQGKGCRDCGRLSGGRRKLTKQEFVDRSNKVHDFKYDYSEFVYENAHTKAVIICPKHGPFPKMPTDHLQGSGCPHCSSSRGEKKVLYYLKTWGLQYIPQRRVCFQKRTLVFDFHLPKHKTFIEYHGRQHYEAVKRFGGQEQLKRQQARDALAREYCRKYGFKLIEIPY